MNSNINTVAKPVAFDLSDSNGSIESMNSVEEEEEKKKNAKDELDELYAPVHRYLKPGKYIHDNV